MEKRLPTPLDLAEARRAGFTVVVNVGDGRKVALPQYLAARRAVESAETGTWFDRAFGGWGMTREEALEEFRRGSLDRINLRAGVTFGKPMSDARVLRNLKRTVTCYCRWCGAEMDFYVRPESRFCPDSDCRRSYYH